MGSQPRHSTGRTATATRDSKKASETPGPSTKPTPTPRPRDEQTAIGRRRRTNPPSGLYEVCERLDLVVDVVHTVCDSMTTYDGTQHVAITLIEHGLEPLIGARDALRSISQKEPAR